MLQDNRIAEILWFRIVELLQERQILRTAHRAELLPALVLTLILPDVEQQWQGCEVEAYDWLLLCLVSIRHQLQVQEPHYLC